MYEQNWILLIRRLNLSLISYCLYILYIKKYIYFSPWVWEPTCGITVAEYGCYSYTFQKKQSHHMMNHCTLLFSFGKKFCSRLPRAKIQLFLENPECFIFLGTRWLQHEAGRKQAAGESVCLSHSAPSQQDMPLPLRRLSVCSVASAWELDLWSHQERLSYLSTGLSSRDTAIQ